MRKEKHKKQRELLATDKRPQRSWITNFKGYYPRVWKRICTDNREQKHEKFRHASPEEN
jgi:hypothetical protein